MYCPAVFRETRLDVLHQAMRDQPLATLTPWLTQSAEATCVAAHSPSTRIYIYA
jgi:predicted FMN-binding regulatory protein PaiB